MAESRATIPDFSLQMDVDMDACVTLRAELKRLSAPEREGDQPLGAPTYNDMVVKAGALALREHRRVNSTYRDGALTLHERVNVGVAVAAEQALVVPTVFDADEKSLGEIARATRVLAERVRAQTITPPELGGATFTVCEASARALAPPIVPPQAAILGVGSVESRPFVQDGSLAVRRTVVLTLVCDHRVLVPAQGAALLERIASLLGQPGSLLP